MAEKAIERGKPADAAILKKVIEVIDVDNDIEVMKKYYSTAEAWEKHRRLYEEGPSREWQELYRDVNAMLGEDPAAPKAQILADRWLKLAVKAYNGDPELQTCNGTAWMDREHWPASMKRRIAEFNLERVNEFMRRAVLSSRKKYFSTEAWAKLVEMRMDTARISAIWQSRVDLFRGGRIVSRAGSGKRKGEGSCRALEGLSGYRQRRRSRCQGRIDERVGRPQELDGFLTLARGNGFDGDRRAIRHGCRFSGQGCRASRCADQQINNLSSHGISLHFRSLLLMTADCGIPLRVAHGKGYEQGNCDHEGEIVREPYFMSNGLEPQCDRFGRSSED